MQENVFDAIRRTDRTPRRWDEGSFEFLNRSASDYFRYVRDLVEEWFSHVPTAHQPGLRGSLRAELHHDSAFWELYLHECYTRSGYTLTFHPNLAHTDTHPDFLVEKDSERFYLEAVTVGRSPRDAGEDTRINHIYRALSDWQTTQFSIAIAVHAIGAGSYPTRALRRDLQGWLDLLDPDDITQLAARHPVGGFESLPSRRLAYEGWDLTFHAIPRRPERRAIPSPALGVMGAGGAEIVDNVTGLSRVIDSKRSKYGDLALPLVLAIQSNTEFPTRDYETEQALYGLSARRPPDFFRNDPSWFRDGLWFSRRAGRRNAHIPQVITVYDLSPSRPTRAVPRLWQTLDPSVTAFPAQPGWLAPMNVEAEALPGPAIPMHEHLELPADWPMPEPDFDTTT